VKETTVPIDLTERLAAEPSPDRIRITQVEVPMHSNRGGAFASLSLAVLAAVVSAGCEMTFASNQFSAREEKRFAVTGTPQLDLSTFDGSIEVRSWDRQEVLIEIEKRGPDKAATDLIRVEATQEGNTISVKIPNAARQVHTFGINISPSARIVASVPRSSNLIARTGDGSITLRRLSGRVSLETGDGSVEVEDVSGELRVRSGDGGVTARAIDGRADIRTEDGSLRLDGRLTAVQVETGDGSATVIARAGSAMAADWDIRTGDGSVVVELPYGFGADLDARTDDGAINVDRLVTPTADTRDRHAVQGKIGGGGKTLRLQTGDGSIGVRGR
jgi:hypothetical protein